MDRRMRSKLGYTIIHTGISSLLRPTSNKTCRKRVSSTNVPVPQHGCQRDSHPSPALVLFPLYSHLPVQIPIKDTRTLEISVLPMGPQSCLQQWWQRRYHHHSPGGHNLLQPAPSSWTELCASTLMLPLMTMPKFQATSWPGIQCQS